MQNKDCQKLRECPFCNGEARIMLEEEDRPDDSFHNVYCTGCGAQFWVKSKSEAEQKWNRRAQPANEPLTLEQLREMYDEPVWVVCGIYKDWRIPEFIDEGGYKGFIKFTDRSAEPISDYGKNWVAYAHKPGGEQNA